MLASELIIEGKDYVGIGVGWGYGGLIGGLPFLAVTECLWEGEKGGHRKGLR
jgi:hypothetical protein